MYVGRWMMTVRICTGYLILTEFCRALNRLNAWNFQCQILWSIECNEWQYNYNCIIFIKGPRFLNYKCHWLKLSKLLFRKETVQFSCWFSLLGYILAKLIFFNCNSFRVEYNFATVWWCCHDHTSRRSCALVFISFFAISWLATFKLTVF